MLTALFKWKTMYGTLYSSIYDTCVTRRESDCEFARNIKLLGYARFRQFNMSNIIYFHGSKTYHA